MTTKKNASVEPLNAPMMQQYVDELDRLCQEVIEIQQGPLALCTKLKELKPKIDKIVSLASALSVIIPALKTLPAAVIAVLAIGEAFCAGGAAPGVGGGEVSGELS